MNYLVDLYYVQHIKIKPYRIKNGNNLDRNNSQSLTP